MRIHHVGYLVKDIDAATNCFLDLGYAIDKEKVYDEIREIEIAFLVNDGYRIELISPCTKNSITTSLLKKYKNMPYHICYETADIQNEIHILEQQGYKQLDGCLIAPAIDSSMTVFLVHPKVGLIELVEL